MNDEKQFGGALCAGVGTADAAAAEVQPVDASGAAPAEGKKKYVPPTMQVIPLGPQRMLATSGVSGPPVQVQIGSIPGFDYYVSFHLYDGGGVRVHNPSTGALLVTLSAPMHKMCIGTGGWDVGCAALGSSFPALIAARAQAMQDYVDAWTSCDNVKGQGIDLQPGQALRYYDIDNAPWVACGPGLIAPPGFTPFWSDAGWDMEDFFANAQFDDCSDDQTFSGTYNGRSFEGTIDEYWVDMEGDHCSNEYSSRW